jgi:hypothetical protein
VNRDFRGDGRDEEARPLASAFGGSPFAPGRSGRPVPTLGLGHRPVSRKYDELVSFSTGRIGDPGEAATGVDGGPQAKLCSQLGVKH